MPIQVTIDRHMAIAILRANGPFSLLDWSAALTLLTNHPARPAVARVLFDRRGTDVADRADFAWTMSALVAERAEDLAGSRWAVLVEGGEAAFSAARLFTASQDLLGSEAAVFRDPDSAVTWLLDGTPTSADDLVRPRRPRRSDADWARMQAIVGEQLRRLGAGLPVLRFHLP